MKYQGQEALLSIMVDVTEHKESERRAAQLESLREVLRTIAAELSTQAAVATTLATDLRSLRDSLPVDSPQRNQAGNVYNAATTLRDALTSLRQQTETALEPPKE